jgi:hypothetical protein
MAEFEHGPRSTDEARAALHRLVQNRWHGGQEPNTHHRACFTIPCDQRRDADCILSDVIEERDRLRTVRDAARPFAVCESVRHGEPTCPEVAGRPLCNGCVLRAAVVALEQGG